MKPALFFLLTAFCAHAGVILNAPDPNSGFFDGMSNYFNFDGTGKIGSISAAQLPETNGIATQKLYGSVAMEGGKYDPYIVMVAWGTASGSFAVDTEVAVHFNFAISPNPENGLPYYVQGGFGTNGGYFYTEYMDGTNWQTEGLTDNLSTNFSYIIPAGLEITSWRVSLGVGQFGAATGLPALALNIPANSIEIVAPPNNAEVPEPITLALTALGIALLIARRLRHPV